jgi:hypothetical protein
MNVIVFWDVMSCLVDHCKCFGGTCFSHLSGYKSNPNLKKKVSQILEEGGPEPNKNSKDSIKNIWSLKGPFSEGRMIGKK